MRVPWFKYAGWQALIEAPGKQRSVVTALTWLLDDCIDVAVAPNDESKYVRVGMGQLQN